MERTRLPLFSGIEQVRNRGRVGGSENTDGRGGPGPPLLYYNGHYGRSPKWPLLVPLQLFYRAIYDRSLAGDIVLEGGATRNREWQLHAAWLPLS